MTASHLKLIVFLGCEGYQLGHRYTEDTVYRPTPELLTETSVYTLKHKKTPPTWTYTVV